MSPSESAKNHRWPIIFVYHWITLTSVVRKVYLARREFYDLCQWLPITHQRVSMFFIPFGLILELNHLVWELYHTSKVYSGLLSYFQLNTENTTFTTLKVIKCN